LACSGNGACHTLDRIDGRRKEVRVRDYENDVEGSGARHRRDRRASEADGNAPIDVSRALQEGDAHALGAQGMLHLQRAAGNAGAASLMREQRDDEPAVRDAIASAGQPLDQDIRDDMETRFGTDFSDVEVHTDGSAADSAQSVSAQAYTVGNHMVFGEGKFQPASDEGRHMIAHELTHVVQQRHGPVDGTPIGGGVKVSDPGDRFEQEADRTATDVLARTAEATLQREAAPEEEEELLEEAAPTEEPAAEVPTEEMEEEEA
jgi:hypothetical protein